MLVREDPHDIDLVIVYDSGKISVDRALDLRVCIQRGIAEISDLSVDVLLLSEREAQNNPLLREEAALLIWESGR